MRNIVYKYVLDLCSLPEDYIKGQEKDTGSQAIRSSLLRTCKVIKDEAMGVVFNTNQFLLYGAQEGDENDILINQMESKYYLRLFLLKTPRYRNFRIHSHYPGFGMCSPMASNHIDYKHLPEILLSRIQYLSVYISNGLKDPITRPLRTARQPSVHGPETKLPSHQHWDNICYFLKRCTVLHHLYICVWLDMYIYPEMVVPLPLPTPVILSFIEDLSHVNGVHNLQLFVQFRKCSSKHGVFEGHPKDQCCKTHVLSAKYFRHVVKCMGMPKGSEPPKFGDGNRIRDIDSTLMNWEKFDDDLWVKSIEDDGDERLDLTDDGWAWDYGYGRNGESFHDNYRNHLEGRRYLCECSGENVGGLFGHPPKKQIEGASIPPANWE